jgi:hypothetical protein
MARNKVTIDFKGFDEYMEKLDKLGGTDLMKRGVEAGLTASKQYVNQEIKNAIKKSNLPAKGKYSKGDTEKSLDKDYSTKVHGTPRMKPVEGLYEAIYGKKTKTKIRKLQKEALGKVIKRHMEG